MSGYSRTPGSKCRPRAVIFSLVPTYWSQVCLCLIPPASRELVHQLPTRDWCNPTVSGLKPLLWSRTGGASTSQLALILLLCCNVSTALGYGCAYVFSCSQIWQMLWDDLKIFWIPDRAWHSVMHVECYGLNCVLAKSLCWSPNIKHLKHDHVWK